MFPSRPSGLRHLLPAVAVLAAGVLPLAPTAAQPKKDKADAKADAKLAEKLAAVRDAQKAPAVFGAIVEGEKLLALAATGVRKADEPEKVTADDLVHLGSDTKAMTATVIALLVEKKKLKWTSTVGQVLPGLKGKVHPDYLGVTVTQLLAHEGGVIPNIDWWSGPQNQTTRDQRAALLLTILKDAPADRPGTKYVYSNAGFVVAGAMAEEVSGMSWEELTATTLFKPLGMKTAGFGSPGRTGGLDQAWGHKLVKDKLEPSQRDNAPALGPAGTAHASMADWAKFATLHLQGAQGKGKLLKAESFARLHTPADGFGYAGGWLVGKDGTLSHDGSNTLWYARARIRPGQNTAVLAATNLGGDEGRKTVDEIEKVLDQYYRDRFGKK